MQLTTLTRALAVAGWSERAVHVFCWLSPPCETYSGMALGTLSNERWGGPQREGKDDAYRPVSGSCGAEARKAEDQNSPAEMASTIARRRCAAHGTISAPAA